MTKKILIVLNVVALLGCIYWLLEECKPEPFVAVIMSFINIIGITQEEKINKSIFKSKQSNTITGGSNTIAGSINNQINNFAESKLRSSSQTNRIPTQLTSTDGDLASFQPIKEKPVGSVKVIVNTTVVPVGDGIKTEGCYFSADGGMTAKFICHIEVGDKLYWNGSIAGYELGQNDDLRFDYLVN